MGAEWRRKRNLAVERSGRMLLTVGGRRHKLPYYRGLLAREAPEECDFPGQSESMSRLAVVAKTDSRDFREAIRESVTPSLEAGLSVVLVGTKEQPDANAEIALFRTVH